MNDNVRCTYMQNLTHKSLFRVREEKRKKKQIKKPPHIKRNCELSFFFGYGQ